MSEKEIKINYEEYDSPEQLSDEDRNLLATAMEATKTSYAPYSGFCVGAALLLENGKIIRGSNQENAAYPSGLCAERVALFSAGSQYPDVAIKTIAITAYTDKIEIDFPVSPCGACRQVIAEYEHKQQKSIKVILRGSSGKILIISGVDSLLPFVFNADSLK